MDAPTRLNGRSVPKRAPDFRIISENRAPAVEAGPMGRTGGKGREPKIGMKS
jgi:hypothetical protein